MFRTNKGLIDRSGNNMLSYFSSFLFTQGLTLTTAAFLTQFAIKFVPISMSLPACQWFKAAIIDFIIVGCAIQEGRPMEKDGFVIFTCLFFNTWSIFGV